MILVTGGNGQLAKALQQEQPQNLEVLYLNRDRFDISNPDSAKEYFESNNSPTHIINTAAYTAVDKAESEEAQALLANAIGVLNLALHAPKETKIIHVSTDFVFDGKKDAPYLPEDTTNPLNAYGRSKLAGEKLLLRFRPDSLIVRTSWLYSRDGRNFVTTMQKLLRQNGRVKVLNNQFGLPTNAHDLAKTLFIMTQQLGHSGIYHFSNSGQPISWYEFAKAIQEISEISSEVIGTDYYPTPAVRPRFSALNSDRLFEDFDIAPKNWRQSLVEELT